MEYVRKSRCRPSDRSRRRCSAGLLVLLAAVLGPVAPEVSARSHPARSVQVVVPTTPAGITDMIARLVSQRLTDQFGQSFVVENRPGANGNVAAENQRWSKLVRESKIAAD